jgi:hypothetical protein
MTRRLVLQPDVPFTELEAVLARSNWSGGPTIAFAPLVPGEPELARWAKHGATLDYACNPAIWFRTLEGNGVADAEWSALSADVRHLDEPAAIALLDEPFDEIKLVGLFALRTLGAKGAGAAIARLTSDPSPLVREAALQLQSGL